VDKFKGLVSASILIIVVALTYRFSPVQANNTVQQLVGEISPADSQEIGNWIGIYSNGGDLKIHVSGTKTLATSAHPEEWFIKSHGPVITRAFFAKEVHGIKLRFGSDHENASIFFDGQFWPVKKSDLRPLLESDHKTAEARIENHAVWFNGQKLVNLPKNGIPGEWRERPDLDIAISSNFRGTLHLVLNQNCKAALDEWEGKELVANVDGNSYLSSQSLKLQDLVTRSNQSSTIDIKVLDCHSLDASATTKSVVNIAGGSIEDARICEVAGGKVVLSAKVKDFEKTQPQQVVKKQGPRGPIQEFPKYGDFQVGNPPR
jgi:hypothetical protein